MFIVLTTGEFSNPYFLREEPSPAMQENDYRFNLAMTYSTFIAMLCQASDTRGMFLRETRPRALPVPDNGCFIQIRG